MQVHSMRPQVIRQLCLFSFYSKLSKHFSKKPAKNSFNCLKDLQTVLKDGVCTCVQCVSVSIHICGPGVIRMIYALALPRPWKWGIK